MSTFDPPYIPRRVVTGLLDGKPAFLVDGPTPDAVWYDATPGFMNSVIYRTAATDTVPISGAGETAPYGTPLLPAPGGTSLLIVTFPPDAVYASQDFDGRAAAAEQIEFAPDFAAKFDPEAPGIHQTDSIDYDIVLDGTIWLELDGKTRELHAGDVVVQGGIPHAWRNKGDRSATLCFVLVGATPG